MKDLLEKKDKLCYKSVNLQNVKFDIKLSKEQVGKLLIEQDKIYKQYIFYKEYIKSINKEKRK